MRFDLSGKAGSFMYMAPEVFKSQSYNEKVSNEPLNLVPRQTELIPRWRCDYLFLGMH